MSKRRIGGLNAVALSVLCLFGTGCVDAFGGSALLMDFQSAVNPPALLGQVPGGPGTPPFNTFYSFYSVKYVYQTDANGMIVNDGNGDPIIDSSFANKAFDFEIARLVDVASPCFIDIEADPFPGIHTTQELARFKLDFGIADPIAETDKPLQDRITILTAEVRNGFLNPLQNTVKAVVSFSEVLPPGEHPDYPVGTTCIEDGGSFNDIPPSSCIGDASNEVRLRLCREFWDANPTFYQGNDKVFLNPKSGTWYGAVNGTNPKNGAPFVGGAQMFSPSALKRTQFDAFIMNWQYKDLDGDGEPDYPDTVPDQEKSVLGQHYMAGEPTSKTRGVISIEMHNRTITTIEADIAIIPSLGDDDVNF